jgi:ribosomal protein S21
MNPFADYGDERYRSMKRPKSASATRTRSYYDQQQTTKKQRPQSAQRTRTTREVPNDDSYKSIDEWRQHVSR